MGLGAKDVLFYSFFDESLFSPVVLMSMFLECAGLLPPFFDQALPTKL